MILGIGNALVDIMTKLENDSFLEENNLPKGSMQLIDHELSEILDAKSTDLEKSLASGGSAANTIHGIARLGMQTGFIGKVGNDEFGNFFHNDLENNKIESLLHRVDEPTGKALALISPDSERTFGTFLGAAVGLTADDIIESEFQKYQILHIEGYLVQNHDLMLAALEMAKKTGMKISLDLASFNVVEANHEFLINIVEKYVDIVFANEEEAKAYTNMEPEEALEELSQICEIAVVKVGKEGSFIKRGKEKVFVAPMEAERRDTTGAGDLYAAGFLFGLVKGYSLESCGKIGTLLASKVIEVIGAKMDDSRWSDINASLENMGLGTGA
ncbi:MAG: adenosine kinase [Bacteroidales bacterium]|nr:adenosine kinase [Bacteroidales bacterium]